MTSIIIPQIKTETIDRYPPSVSLGVKSLKNKFNPAATKTIRHPYDIYSGILLVFILGIILKSGETQN